MRNWYTFSKYNDVDDSEKFESIVKYILSIWALPNIEILSSQAKRRFEAAKDRICKVKLADYEDGVIIYFVNGDEIKSKLYMDFVEGGHDVVYGEKASDEERNFMPPKEVWIDANVDPNSMPYILCHELYERYLMDRKSMEYEDAHEICNKMEKILRTKKIFEHRRRVLDFPATRQADGSTCGHTSVINVLRYYGIDAQLNEVLHMFSDRENQEGMSPQQLVQIAAKFGHKAQIVRGFSIEKIKECIDRNMPVIIELQAWPEDENKDLSKAWDEGHWVVAIGYTSKYIIFSDSSIFGKDYLAHEELMKRWHDIDYGRKNVRLVVLVYGKSHYDQDNIQEMG